MSKKRIALALLFGSSAFLSPAHAQIAVVDMNASSTASAYDVNDLINGSGLFGSLHSGNFPDKWISAAGDVTPTLTFDLGAEYNITNALIWNYGGGCCGYERSVQGFDYFHSLDGIAYNFGGSFSLLYSNSTPIHSQNVGLSGTGRYLRFEVTSNYGSSITSGLSEVQFFGNAVTGVPEPSTWAMMLIGFGAVGASTRRRRIQNLTQVA